MQPNKTFFFAIIGLAILAVVAMFLVRLFLAEPLHLSTGAQEVSIRVVVAPSIQAWVEQAAREFNQANPNIQVTVIAADKLIPETQFQPTSPAAPLPAAWLTEASFVVGMAPDSGLQFQDAQSVASTSLAWGAYNDKLQQFTQQYGPLNWENLHAKATDPPNILKVVIASPENSGEGLAALISATAAHLGKPTLSGSDISAANDWLTETLGNGNLATPPTPAPTFAGVQGRTIGDVGLLSLASWRSARLDQSNDFTVTPAEPNVTLDYPFAIWAGSQATPESQQAAVAFRNFLLSEAQQNALANFFFERAGAGAANSVQADDQAAINLLRWAERELR